jgi:hypothetical protein
MPRRAIGSTALDRTSLFVDGLRDLKNCEKFAKVTLLLKRCVEWSLETVMAGSVHTRNTAHRLHKQGASNGGRPEEHAKNTAKYKPHSSITPPSPYKLTSR